MCGIFFSLKRRNEKINDVDNVNFLKHRGPDNTKVITHKILDFEITFANVLLNTIGEIDVSYQPIDNEKFTIICNGTIYNYREIQNTKNESDILCLGEGLFDEGEDFLKKCDGVYAFIFLNKVKNEIIISRDYFGVRPLYIYEKENLLQISSEYKAFKYNNEKINDDVLNFFFNYRFIPGDNTLLKEIKKIEQGSIIKIKLNSSFKQFSKDKKLKINTLINPKLSLNKILNKSIENRSISNNSIAVLQSGGIDSCLISFLLKKKGIEFDSYILKSNDKEDFENAVGFCKSNSINLNIIEEQKYNFQDLKRIIYHLDDPYGDPIILSLDTLAKEISKNKRVCLAGEGVDEVFFGYPHHKIFYILKIIDFLNCKKFLNFTLKYISPKLIQSFLGYTLKFDQNEIDSFKNKIINIKSSKEFYKLIKIFSENELKFQKTSIDYNIKAENYDIRNIDLEEWLPNSQLFKMDKIFMQYSVEVREPYLSKDFIAKSLTYNGYQNIGLYNDKKVFRKMAQNLGFPLKYIQKKKSSFTNDLFFQKSLIDEIKDKIQINNYYLENFFDKKFLETIVNDKSNNVMINKKTFIIGTFLAWIENNEKKINL